MSQTASTVLMIRPVNFAFNEQTSESNVFQKAGFEENVQLNALHEFDSFVDNLRGRNINVYVIDDTPSPHTPDSIFPNNWISLHNDGSVFLYPMQAENRRLERRDDIIDELRKSFTVLGINDLSYHETEGKFLEGTGSMVLDRENKIAYACLSPRTDREVLEEFARKAGYDVVAFNSADETGKAIYHTNVMMCIGDRFAVICLDSISNEAERNAVTNSFTSTGKEIIEISFSQMNNFAGNMLQLKNSLNETFVVMSQRAFNSLTEDQIKRLNNYSQLIYSDLSTIENNGGGSARCMIAEIHLPKNDTALKQ
ncbi:amidinotransferase [Pedobacter sp. HMF7647]|uniref:Amidinotransferase n=1 Tax=Hufsiella arboris TaxID=2695275 RepID=A0A7K1Y8Z4_9SPHI|nr:arginine deiminase-related protein [Hufsiella arboris]MXV50549.1 amidinotransferase [Hufsiella arboris]